MTSPLTSAEYDCTVALWVTCIGMILSSIPLVWLWAGSAIARMAQRSPKHLAMDERRALVRYGMQFDGDRGRD